jgi:hypothetical protein
MSKPTDYRTSESVERPAVPQEEETSNEHIAAYPYRPPVGETPPNDIPFIFKSREEFPAGSEDWDMSRTVLRRGCRRCGAMKLTYKSRS